MIGGKRNLVLFTLEYPFGTAETFLETEILYLANAFDRVYVFPSHIKNGEARFTPSNVEVIKVLGSDIESYHPKKLICFLKYLVFAFIYSFVNSRKRISYFLHFKSMLHHFYNDIRKIVVIRDVVLKLGLGDGLFYDYWLANSSLSLFFLKREGVISKIVCRAHRFDLYDSRNIEKVVPFKELRLKAMNKIFCVSLHGFDYLMEQYKKLKPKVRLEYLGVEAPIALAQKTRFKEFSLVSCSSLLDFKRVHLIVEALKFVKKECRWIHFGSGPEMEKIKKKAALLPSNIIVELKGHTGNSEVMEFYQTYHIDCFISLSGSEGLPVSMMEAQSMGIPIVAPSINGIPEIVNEKTGILLAESFSIEQVVESLNQFIDKEISFDRKKIFEHFDSNFNANRNYSGFSDTLLEINDT